MKKVTLLILILIGIKTLGAQDIQLHYNFANELYKNKFCSKSSIKTKLENLSFDKWGSTYFVADLDIVEDGMNQAYTEIKREILLGKLSSYSVHLEYNGGLHHCNKTKEGIQFHNSYYLGLTYSINSIDFSKGIAFSTSYKYIQKLDQPHNVQFSTVWYCNFLNDVYSFNGYLDIWSEKSNNTEIKLLIEPEIWINLDKIKNLKINAPISISGQVEVSTEFCDSKIFFLPNIGIKWRF